MKKCFWVIWVVGSFSVWAAPIEPYEFANETDRALFQKMTHELRCLTCEAQSIAESNAPWAQDLRREVYRLIQEGGDEMAILTFMTDRYGDSVLYKPPFNQATWVLWLGPFMLLLLGGFILGRIVSRQKGN